MLGRWLFWRGAGEGEEDSVAAGGDLVRVEEVVERAVGGYDGAADEEDGAGDGDDASTASLSFVTAAHDAGVEGDGENKSDGDGVAVEAGV